MSDGAGLGYWVGRPSWNRGFATEAGQAILDHARSLGVRTIMAETFPENRASARVLSKLGFTADGQMKRTCLSVVVNVNSSSSAEPSDPISMVALRLLGSFGARIR